MHCEPMNDEVKNKTIIGLKLRWFMCPMSKTHVKNKTIIGLKF